MREQRVQHEKLQWSLGALWLCSHVVKRYASCTTCTHRDAHGHHRIDERLARGRVAARVDAERGREHHAVDGEHIGRLTVVDVQGLVLAPPVVRELARALAAIVRRPEDERHHLGACPPLPLRENGNVGMREREQGA